MQINLFRTCSLFIFFLKLPYIGQLVIINYILVSFYTWCIVTDSLNYKLEIHHQIIDKQRKSLHIHAQSLSTQLNISSSYIETSNYKVMLHAYYETSYEVSFYSCIPVSSLPILKSYCNIIIQINTICINKILQFTL